MKIKDENIIKLIHSALAGKKSAYAEIISHIEKDLFKFCFYLCKNQQEAEDLYQDSCLQILQSLQSLKDIQLFKSWIFQIAKNKYLDFLKSPKNQKVESLDVLENKISNDSTDQLDQVIRLKKALSQFDDDERLVLVLVDLHGFSYNEAAGILGVSEPSLRSKLSRIRQKFIAIY